MMNPTQEARVLFSNERKVEVFEYETAQPDATLYKDGFEVIKLDQYLKEEIFYDFHRLLTRRSLEKIAWDCLPQNVFRTKLGDIKQIQSLQTVLDLEHINGHLAQLLAQLLGSMKS